MRTPFGWALALGAMAMANAAEPFSSIAYMPEAPSSGVQNYHRKIRRSRYMPHQNKRECERRIRQGLCPS